MLIMDINFTAEDTSISPPWNFLSKEFIQNLLDLSPNFVTINVLCTSKESEERLEATLKEFGTHIVTT